MIGPSAMRELADRLEALFMSYRDDRLLELAKRMRDDSNRPEGKEPTGNATTQAEPQHKKKEGK